GSICAGYRLGRRDRTLTTSRSGTTIDPPQAWIETANRGCSTWHSQMIPRDQPRIQRVDQAIFYLSGTNTGRLRGVVEERAIASGSTCARRPRVLGQAGSHRVGICYMFLDGWNPRVPNRKRPATNLFTFARFATLQWKVLRSTNTVERINEEFRRRTQTQGPLPSEDAVLLLPFGLLRSGQVALRSLVGWQPQ